MRVSISLLQQIMLVSTLSRIHPHVQLTDRETLIAVCVQIEVGRFSYSSFSPR